MKYLYFNICTKAMSKSYLFDKDRCSGFDAVSGERIFVAIAQYLSFSPWHVWKLRFSQRGLVREGKDNCQSLEHTRLSKLALNKASLKGRAKKKGKGMKRKEQSSSGRDTFSLIRVQAGNGFVVYQLTSIRRSRFFYI